MTWEDIPGWFDFGPLYDRTAASLPPGAVIAEVGCWLGRSAAYMGALVASRSLETPPCPVTFWAVDHGFGSVGRDQHLHADALEFYRGNVAGALACNLRDCGLYPHVNVLVVPSVRAAALFPDAHFDFVFVDGDHRRESVLADLGAWWPKVRPGGTLAGHDYDRHWPEVVAAVNEFFGREVPDPTCPHCWSVVK